MNLLLIAAHWVGVAVLTGVLIGRAIRHADTQEPRRCYCGTC